MVVIDAQSLILTLRILSRVRGSNPGGLHTKQIALPTTIPRPTLQSLLSQLDILILEKAPLKSSYPLQMPESINETFSGKARRYKDSDSKISLGNK